MMRKIIFHVVYLPFTSFDEPSNGILGTWDVWRGHSYRVHPFFYLLGKNVAKNYKDLTERTKKKHYVELTSAKIREL